LMRLGSGHILLLRIVSVHAFKKMNFVDL
jgi:hypothetical protein